MGEDVLIFNKEVINYVNAVKVKYMAFTLHRAVKVKYTAIHLTNTYSEHFFI